VNCHGSFLLGLFVAGIYLASSFVDFRMGLLVSERWDARQRWMLALALVLSAGALFVNPIGIKQILYPLNTMLHQPVGLSIVQEWQPLQVNSARGAGLLGTLGCLFLLVLLRRSELFAEELVLLAVATWLAASHQRMTFVFGILVAPIISRLLSTAWDGYDAEADRPLPNAIVIVAAVLVVFWAFPNRQALSKQVEQQSPVKAVEFINTHNLSGRMLNDYVYGGYLIWAAPKHPVFVDGRADVFEWNGVLGDYGSWATLQSTPNVLLDKYNIDFCLLPRQSPLVRFLPLLHGWKLIYSDGGSVIFARAGA
jgi:hypothetical protein